MSIVLEDPTFAHSLRQCGMSSVSYRVRLSPSAVFQELNGEAVLLDLSQETYFGLDTVATALWRELQQQDDLEAAIVALLDSFEVDRPRLESDVFRFLRQLTEQRLVEVTPPLPPTGETHSSGGAGAP